MSIDTSRTGAQRGLTQSAFVRSSAPRIAGPEGILYDFNYGCRVQVPTDGWRVRMLDLDTFNQLFDEPVEAHTVVTSRRKYFVRFELQVFDGERLVFQHRHDARGRNVLIRPNATALGDMLAWMPAIEAFRQQEQCVMHVVMPAIEAFRQQEQCVMHVVMPAHLQTLFAKAYPEVRLILPDSVDEMPGGPFYATYHLGFFSPCAERDHQPTDPRISSLQDFASYLLGVPRVERRPKVVSASTARVVPERYVCIAAQASMQCKYWNNPRGWPTLIAYLKSRGYRVLCIDQHREYGTGEFTNTMPEGCEDFTGNRPLEERVSLLMHADFFVGLGSGLSWLAWAAGIPVVMISGFSHPHSEFHTPYRAINFHACNSCFNDTSNEYDTNDFLWCPRRRDTPGRFQCTSAISPEQIIAQVERLIADHGLR